MRFGIGFAGEIPTSEIVELTKLAELKGFDYAWIADENPSYPFRDVFVNMTAAALATKVIKIGSSVFVPYSRHPALLAVFASTLAELVGDRIALGIGRGGSMVLGPLGLKMWDKPLATLRESLIVIKRLFAGEQVDFEGKAVKIKGVKLATLPRKKIPVYLAARGLKALEMVGELADGAILSCPPRADALSFSFDQMKRGLEKFGRSREDIDVVNFCPFAVSEDRSKALDMVRLEVAFASSDTPDIVHQKIGTDMTRLNEVRRALREEGLEKAMKAVTYEMLADFSIAGTVDDCIEKIAENFKNGVDQVTVAIMGDKKKTLELFGREILPNFG